MNGTTVSAYGDHWLRKKMFRVADGRVSWTDLAWPDEKYPERKPLLAGRRGLYVLYRGEKPIYVGIATKGEDALAARIHAHTKDWLAPWWDSVCWYDFGDRAEELAPLVESFLISHGVGLWNGAETGGQFFGTQVYLEGGNNASVDLWSREEAAADRQDRPVDTQADD
jgi:hypothetical protein